MPAKVFCLISAKGGAGKTVIAASIGAFLTGIGKKVLIADVDASTNGLTLLYLREMLQHRKLTSGVGEKPKGAFEPWDAPRFPEIFALPTGCHLLPATYYLENTGKVAAEDFQKILLQTVTNFRNQYDYIILDAQPGSDAFASAVISRKISDEVIIVSEFDALSNAGVERLKTFFAADLTPERTWVLLNKMLPEFVAKYRGFTSHFNYLSPIPWDAEVVRAYARNTITLDIHNGNAYTLAIMQTVQSLLGMETSREISRWADTQAEGIRQPIRERITIYQSQLKNFASVRREMERRDFERAARVVAVYLLLAESLGQCNLVQDIFVQPLTAIGLGTAPGAGRMVVAAAILVSGFVLFLYRIGPKSNGSSPDNRARVDLQRESASVEEKLRKLESLVHADLESLLKQRAALDPPSR